MKITDVLVVKMLEEQNYVTQEDIEKARAELGKNREVEYLLNKKILNRDLIAQAISEYLGIEYFKLNFEEIGEDKLSKIPRDIVERYMVIYLGETKDTVKIALGKPELVEEFAPEITRIFPDKKLDIKFILEEDFAELMFQYKRPLQDRFEKLLKTSKATTHIFEEILDEAFNQKSTDIHMEPQHDGSVIIRFRLDGFLEEMASVDSQVYSKIINRVKVLSKLRIDEHRAAQDGAIRISNDNYSMDLRVSIIPILEGEKISIRILSNYVKSFSLSELGLSSEDQEMIRKVSNAKQGMILNTGPTG